MKIGVPPRHDDATTPRPLAILWGLWRWDLLGGPYRYGDWIRTVDSHHHQVIATFGVEGEAIKAAAHYTSKVKDLKGNPINVIAAPVCGSEPAEPEAETESNGEQPTREAS